MKPNVTISKNGEVQSNNEFVKKFNEKLFQLEKEFTNKIDGFLDANKNEPFIFLSATLSRSIHQSKIYYDYCLLKNISEFLDNGYQIDYLEIGPELHETIQQTKKIDLEKISKFAVISNNTYEVKNLLRLVKFLIIKLFQITLIRTNFNQSKNIEECKGLFSSYVFKGAARQNYYFGNELNSENSESAFCPVIIDTSLRNLFSTISELKKIKSPLIFKEHYLSFKDLLKGLAHYSNERRFSKDCVKTGSIDFLISKHLSNALFNTQSLEAHLNMFGFSKLFSKVDIPRKLIVSWENQASEKAIIYSAQNHTDTETIGYISRPIKQNEFNLISSEQEVKNCLCPSRLFVTGKSALKKFHETNPKLNVSLGPNLRFRWNGDAHKKIKDHVEKKNLIFLFPGENKLFESLEQMVDELIEANIHTQFNFYAKLHPYFKHSKGLNNNIELVDQKIEDFPNGAIVVSTASIAALESAAKGFRTVLFIEQYNEWETALYSSSENYSIPTFKDTSELIKIINETSHFTSIDTEKIENAFFNNSINEGLDFFYK